MLLHAASVVLVSVKELDLTSTFVSKAAVIARRKLEHKSKPEQKAKKSPVKEKPKTVPEKVQDEPLVTTSKMTFCLQGKKKKS